ncbi:transporter [Vibrio anguillarum]|uniref:Transporter n=2 Tax=Vibrionaceae TaxID=641 RepID=A0AAW4AHP7_VIBAN|nr:Transporter [Vibrio anguillarum 775]AGU57933.1 transporter [Vibrio anguillarum M3]ASF91579.1 transporter [Vibrio anguillarum]NAW89891.1 transporter [Vibrio sp. V24_P1S3T111]NAX16815.1 transporter [Vibrio sp. V22_P2S10T140]NNN47087.1 transporter [Vibrio sp. 2-2(8)]NNN68923.1 transporter [Vibrio sp. 3-2(1)]OXX19981.1 transporter [Vibrio sp. V06_P1A73T115]OXX20745.1 transporter [Vibrio sp. V05_P4A8T149]OXX31983.1 transporter [Vibrio sp. V04_P4A5T148]OXX36668.1 transporter [Vibrio sp. V14_
MSGDKMNTQERRRVVFDYTTFLGASCNKKWTFLEAMTSFAPIFGTVWKDSIKELSSPEDRLWEMALKSLSTRRSDEANLISLVRLAKLEGIEELKLVMPYALDSEQIQLIQNKSQSLIKNTKPDEFIITL